MALISITILVPARGGAGILTLAVTISRRSMPMLGAKASGHTTQTKVILPYGRFSPSWGVDGHATVFRLTKGSTVAA